jgi:hypothetical protein
MIRDYVLTKTASRFEALGISVAVGVLTPGAFTAWNLGVAVTILVVMALVVVGMETWGRK